MKHSTPKRLLAVVLSLLMMFTVVQSFPENIFRDSAITADAASDPITDKINIIKGLFPTGTAFTANGYKNNPKDKNANANSNCYLPNIMKSNPKIKAQ